MGRILRPLKTLFRLLFIMVLIVGGAKTLDYEWTKKQAAQKEEQERIWAWQREQAAKTQEREVEENRVAVEAAIKAGSRMCVNWHKENIWFLRCTPNNQPCQLKTDICEKYEPRN